MSKRRRFTPESKSQVVLQVLTGAKNSAEVCRAYELGAPLLASWKTAFPEQAAVASQGDELHSTEQTRIALGKRGLQSQLSPHRNLWRSIGIGGLDCPVPGLVLA